MINQFRDILGVAIHAKDGEIGKVKDILYDDYTWDIRYVVVDPHPWLPSSKVLISPESIPSSPFSPEGSLNVNLTKAEIEKSPPLSSDQPVSRHYENALFKHYGWNYYWGVPAASITYPYMDAAPYQQPIDSMGSIEGIDSEPYLNWKETHEKRQENFDGDLRSLKELMGYGILTNHDDVFGEVDDAIVDSEQWRVTDLILNSHKWLPGGKRFVCSPLLIEEIMETEGTIHVGMDKDVLLASPEYKPGSYDSEYRISLMAFYHRSSKKKQQSSQSEVSEKSP